jgi:hypothetical protein
VGGRARVVIVVEQAAGRHRRLCAAFLKGSFLSLSLSLNKFYVCHWITSPSSLIKRSPSTRPPLSVVVRGEERRGEGETTCPVLLPPTDLVRADSRTVSPRIVRNWSPVTCKFPLRRLIGSMGAS